MEATEILDDRPHGIRGEVEELGRDRAFPLRRAGGFSCCHNCCSMLWKMENGRFVEFCRENGKFVL